MSEFGGSVMFGGDVLDLNAAVTTFIELELFGLEVLMIHKYDYRWLKPQRLRLL